MMEGAFFGYYIKPLFFKAFSNFKVALETAYDEAQISTFNGMEAFFDSLRKHDIKILNKTHQAD